MLKLKLQYFDYLMWRANSLEETLMLGKTENKRRRMKWLDGIANTMDMNLSKLQEIVKDRWAGHAAINGVVKTWTLFSDWTTTILKFFDNKKFVWQLNFLSFFTFIKLKLDDLKCSANFCYTSKDSGIHTYIHSFFILFSIMVSDKILKYFSVLYSWTLLFIHFTYTSLHLLTQNFLQLLTYLDFCELQ